MLGNALNSGDGSVAGVGRLKLYARDIQIGDVLANHHIGGNVLVEGTAIGKGDVQSAVGVASFGATATSGNLDITGGVTLHAFALDPGTGAALALANALMSADGSVTVKGNINVSAELEGNGLIGGSTDLSFLGLTADPKFGFASADVTIRTATGDIALKGVTVNADARSHRHRMRCLRGS